MVMLAIATIFSQVQAQPRTVAGGDYPSKPVRWLVGFAPGASNDIIARVIAVHLSDSFGQQVIVDNRGGAAGMIAGETVAKAAPDGHTIVMSTGGPSVFGPMLTKRAPYRVEDFAQVVMIGYTPLIIVAHPAFPPRNPREIVQKLNAEVNRVLNNPDAVRRLQTLGLEVLGGSPEDAEQWVKREAAKVTQLIKLGKLRPE